MSSPVSRYPPSRRYYFLLLLAVAGIAVSAWSGIRWPAAWLAAGGFAVPALALLVLILQPRIEVQEAHLKIGRRIIRWRDIRKLDRTGWNAPLVLRLTIATQERPATLTLIYPGDLDACRSLLRHLRRYSREALLDGIPYPKFWGEAPSRNSAPRISAGGETVSRSEDADAVSPTTSHQPAARHRLLLAEDEAEVERLFQRLKADGHLDHDGPIGQHGGGSPLASGGDRSPDEK